MTDFADISYPYQAGADLDAYAHSGRDRLMMKATEGTGYTNPVFASWWQHAGQLGLARGAYHFARPSQSSGMAEADHFVAVVEAAGGVGPRDWVCLDAEDPNDHANAGGRHAADFCYRLMQHGYPAGVIYTGTWYATPVGLISLVLPVGWRRLHLATYNAAVADSAMPLPAGWDRSQVVARQYTNAAVQPGIPGKSDSSRVLLEWLETPMALTLSPEDLNAIGSVVAGQLNQGTANGQSSWAATERAILALEQTLFNVANDVLTALGVGKGALTLAARSDAISGELGRMGDYLAAGGPLATWLTEVGQQLGDLLEAVQALPVSTSGGGDAGPVLAAIADLKATVTSLTLSFVRPLNS